MPYPTTRSGHVRSLLGKQKVAKAVSVSRPDNAKKTKETYASIIKRGDKQVRELDGKYKAQSPNGPRYNSDDYAKATLQFLPHVTALSNMDRAVKSAFDLMREDVRVRRLGEPIQGIGRGHAGIDRALKGGSDRG
jgi:hypothetical protein